MIIVSGWTLYYAGRRSCSDFEILLLLFRLSDVYARMDTHRQKALWLSVWKKQLGAMLYLATS